MDPNALLTIIEDERLPSVERIAAARDLALWLSIGGEAPKEAPFIQRGRDVEALCRGLGLRYDS